MILSNLKWSMWKRGHKAIYFLNDILNILWHGSLFSFVRIPFRYYCLNHLVLLLAAAEPGCECLPTQVCQWGEALRGDGPQTEWVSLLSGLQSHNEGIDFFFFLLLWVCFPEKQILLCMYVQGLWRRRWRRLTLPSQTRERIQRSRSLEIWLTWRYCCVSVSTAFLGSSLTIWSSCHFSSFRLSGHRLPLLHRPPTKSWRMSWRRSTPTKKPWRKTS